MEIKSFLCTLFKMKRMFKTRVNEFLVSEYLHTLIREEYSKAEEGIAEFNKKVQNICLDPHIESQAETYLR